MKRFFFCCCVMFCFSSLSQETKQNNSYIDINYLSGNIALHNPDILHLITGHPNGLILGWNKKTFGEKAWQHRFNYPDYGLSFMYQDFKNEILGNNYSLFAHYNFYFFKRHLMLRVAQGLAYNTNPYDKLDNPKNIAFGSSVLSSSYLMLNFKKENLIGAVGLQAGLTLTHASNANVKAPNTSINTINLNVGLNYNFDKSSSEYISNTSDEKFTEPIKFNLAFRSGINQSDVLGSGQFPFYIFSAYADKRLSRKSAIQFGTDVFFSNFLKELIKFKSIAFPEEDLVGDEDYKRVGLFVGHELFINKLSVETQLGYYVYYPFDFEGRTYIRIGLKHYFGNRFFGAVTLKSHGAKAEAIEFGVGVRL